jgi:hypothetical protein
LLGRAGAQHDCHEHALPGADRAHAILLCA